MTRTYCVCCRRLTTSTIPGTDADGRPGFVCKRCDWPEAEPAAETHIGAHQAYQADDDVLSEEDARRILLRQPHVPPPGAAQ